LTLTEPTGMTSRVLTYIKVDARRGPPTASYLGHIETGFRDWGLDPALLRAALAMVAAAGAGEDGSPS